MAVFLALVGTMDLSAATLINRWDFNDAIGTTLNNLARTGPGSIAFPGAGDGSIVTDGSGSLVYTGANQFVVTSGGLSTTQGIYELEFHLNSMTRVDTVNSGWSLRGAGSINIGVIVFAQNNAGNGLRLFAFTTTGNNLNAFDYGAVSSIDHVTVRAVLTLTGASAGTLDIYAKDDNVDMGAGVGVEAYLGSLPTQADVTFNGISTYKQSFTAGESAYFDYLQLASTVAYKWDTVTGDGSAITEGGGTWQVGVGNWNNAGSDVTWADGNNAVFGGGSAGTAGTVTLGGNVVPGSITFDAENAGDYTIDVNGNQLTLPDTEGGVLGKSGFAPVSISDSAGTGAVVLSGDDLTMSLISGTTSTDSGLIVNAKVTGAHNVLATGAGNLALNNASSDFTGSVAKQNAGFIKLASIKNNGVASAAGAGSLIRLGSGAGLAYSGTGDAHNRTLELFGDAGTFSVYNNGSGPLVFTGPVSNLTTGASTLDLRGSFAGTNAIQGVIVDSGAFGLSVTKNDPDVWSLSGLNTYSGGTMINRGSLIAAGQSSLGSGTVSMSDGGGIAFIGLYLRHPNLDLANNIVISNANDNAIYFDTYTNQTISGDILIEDPSREDFRLFSSNQTYVLRLSGTISGAGGFTTARVGINGGHIILSGSNTFSGGVQLEASTILELQHDHALGTGGLNMGIAIPELWLGNGVNVGNGLTTSNINFNTPIKLANGATAATYSGAISHSAGVDLQLSPASGQTLTLSGSLGGTGTYHAVGGGSVLLNGTNSTMTGNFKVGNYDHTRLVVGDSRALGGATVLAWGESEFAAASAGVVITNHIRFPLSNNSYFLGTNDFTISGTVTGAQGSAPQNVYISGSANVTFAGDIGATALEYPRFYKTGSGSLRFSHADPVIYSLSIGNAGGGVELGSGTLLTISGYNPEISATTSGSITGGTLTTASGDSTLRIDLSAGAALTIGSKISGANAGTLLLVGGSGSVLTLTSPDSDFGGSGADVNSKILQISSGTIAANTIGNTDAPGPLGDSQRIFFYPATGGGDAAMRYTGPGETSDKQWGLGTLTDTYQARIEASGSGPLQLNGSFVNVAFAGDKTITLGGTGTGILNNTSSEVQGKISLSKTNSGTWVMSKVGVNHTGTTTINGGNLKVNGTYTGNGAWTVNSGGMLSGTGTINGAVTVNGIVAPGDSGIGTLTVNGNVTWGSTATPGANTDWRYDLAAGDSADLLDISGNFTKSGSGNFRFDFGGTTEVGTFTLVEWSGTTTFSAGNFSATGVGGGNSATFSIVGNTLIVSIGNCSGGSPTITLGNNPASCGGVTELPLPYVSTTLDPNTYIIDYDATAETAGFVDVATRRPLGIINDNFISDSTVIDAGNSLNEFDTDFTWHKNNFNSSWSVTGGQLVNNPDPSDGYDEKDEGLIGQMVDMSGFAGSTLTISFDYNVGAGNTLYLHVRGADDQGSLQWSIWLGAPNGSAWDTSPGGTGNRYNLLNGQGGSGTLVWPDNGAFQGATALTGSGTYVTNIDISGYAVSDLADYEYLMVGFAMNVTADNNTTIDNVLVTSGNLPVIMPGAVANGTYNGTITVYNTNNCSSSENFTVTITGNAPATPGAISGQSRVCASDSGLAYSISQVAGATGYVWSAPLGVLVTSTNPTKTGITVDWNGADSGTISVFAQGVCGDSSGSRSLSVTADAAAPGAPTVLAAANVTQSGFDARWDQQSVAEGYYLDMATLPDFSAASLVVSNEKWTVNTKDTRTFSNLELGNYYYRLRSYNACGISDNSGIITVTVHRVIANWDVSAQSGGAGNYGVSPLPPRTYPTIYVTVTGLTRGPGVSTSGTGLAGGWGGEGWDAGSQAAAEAAGDYLTFTIVPNASVNVNYSSIDVLNLRVEANGPTDGMLQYSLDSGASFTDILALSYTTTVGGAYAPLPIDLSGVSELQNVAGPVTFRLVNWGATDSAADWYIYDVNASTSPDLQLLGSFCEDPTLYSVTGGGVYCQPAGTPPSVGLSGSQLNVAYQLYHDEGEGPVADGSPVFGTGSAIHFGVKESTGTYTVVATRLTGSGCSVGMSGSAVVTMAYTPDVPTGLAAAWDSINGEVDLTWNSAAGASNYVVYRATLQGGPYVSIGNVGTTGYSDDSVIRNEIEYFYVITASSGGCETAYSGEVSATTDVECQSGVAPALTAPGDITVNAGDSVQHAITASDSASSCGTPTIVQYPSTLPSYITYVDSPSGPNRTRTYTIAPTPGDNGEVRPIRVVTWDDDGNTNDYTFVVYVGSQAANTYAITITALAETTPNTAADLTFESEEGLAYDVYSSPTPPGSSPIWTKIDSGIPAGGVSVTESVVASGQMRFYQVAPAGVSRTDNGIWGIVRPSVPGGTLTYMAPPLPETESDLDFSGNLGDALAEVLTDPDDRIYVMTSGTNPSMTTLRLAGGEWIIDGGGAYTTPLEPGQGFLIDRDSGSASPTFEGPVGNSGGKSITLEPGYNLIGISEGEALSARTAFENASPLGDYNPQDADLVYVLNSDGSFRQLWRLGNNTWYDTVDRGTTTMTLTPGQSYFYIRRGGQTELDF